VAIVEGLLAIITQVVQAGNRGLNSPRGEPGGSQASKRRRVSLACTPLLSALTRDLYSNRVEEGVKSAANGKRVGGREEGGVIASGNK
jgi:hypothetical protein